MRHRAQTPLARLAGAARTRRAAAAGTVVLLGAATGGYLTVADSVDLGGEDRTAAGPTAGARDATTYPDAAALEDLRTARTPSTSRGADRGQARTTPSGSVSEGAGPARQPTASGASPATPGASEPGAVAGPQGETARSTAPGAGGETPSTPSGGSTGSPSSPPPSPDPGPSDQPPASPAPSGPETTAVTQVAAGGTWTVALTSDRTLTSFQCSLDGAAYAACGPVATFTGLSQGRHTLAARAVDGAGNVDPTPAVLSTQVSGLL